MHFHDVFIKDIWCTFRLMRSLQPPPLLLQKTLRICANLTTHPGWGRMGTCPPVAMAVVWQHYTKSITGMFIIVDNMTTLHISTSLPPLTLSTTTSWSHALILVRFSWLRP